jgi:transposase
MSSTLLPPLGIDMAKLTFEARLKLEHQQPTHSFPNTPHGFEQVATWLRSCGVERVHACLEATGTYGDGLALFLYEQGHKVSIVNPARVVAFRKSEGIHTKTDKQDAKVLVRYCEQKRPPAWSPTPAEVQLLENLVLRRADLQGMRQQEVNRLENSRWDSESRQSILSHIQSLETQIKALTKRISAHIAAHASLQEQRTYLVSLPGIADVTAAWLLAEGVSATAFSTASQLVGYSGLAIKEEISGTSVRGKASIDRLGNAQLRKCLYMPALVAMRRDPDFALWVAQMRARGKPSKVIIVAVMRKLLRLIYGVLKSKQPDDPRKAFPTHYAQEEKPAA